jgi:hypothetical protein
MEKGRRWSERCREAVGNVGSGEERLWKDRGMVEGR